LTDQTLVRAQLIAALERSDAQRRLGRAERIEWLSLHRHLPGAMFGRPETMRILSEAPDAFVDGHFVAALLLATAFIEHTLIEELQLLGHVKGSPKLGDAIVIAREHKVFPNDWLIRLDLLRLKRNPFSHLKGPENEYSMGVRHRKLRVHPMKLLEADAKEGIELMFDFFVATLREADL
jgi:hypothetical protein